MKRIMMFLLTVFFISLSLDGFSETLSQRRKKLIGVIDEELKEVTRLNKNIGSRDPMLLLRMAELLLEKARHIKDEENGKYLSLSVKKRQSINKKAYFKRSRKYFKQAQKTCYYILKRFPKFKMRSDVYYILAYNAKEFRQEGKAKKFFERAAQTSKKLTNANKRSRIALAEIHYNKKNYRKAIALYEPALRHKDQRWWTKDSFNLAWCYFRSGKKDKAIKKMREIYALRNNRKFENMARPVERDLSFFYAESGRLDEAVAFYREINKDISSNLLKVGKYLKSQGNFTSAEMAFSSALKYVKGHEDDVQINIELLSLYQRFGKKKKHLKICKNLFNHYEKGRLSKGDIEVLIYHVKTESGKLQNQIVGKKYKLQRRVRTKKAAAAVAYFKILAKIESAKKEIHLFHIAETQYAVKKFNQSIVYYDKTYEIGKKKGNLKIQNLALDGMMASLGGAGVSKATNDKYLIKVYKIYITKYPTDPKSNRIYQRLFNFYYEKKKIKKCEGILTNFSKSFPRDWKTQEAMLTRIVDFHKERSNKVELRKWVEKINDGQFVVSKKVANKLRALLLTMQFENVQKASSRGDKKNALKLYVEIYKSPESTKEAKRNAAYNIAVLFHELDNTYHTYKWSKKSLELMTPLNVLEFETSFLLMASGLYTRRKFKESAEVFEMIYQKLCKKKAKNKNAFFKNAIIIGLANKELKRGLRILNSGKKCGVSKSVITDEHLDILKYLVFSKSWTKAGDEFKKLKNRSNITYELIPYAEKIRKAFLNAGSVKMAHWYEKEIFKLYRLAKRKRKNIPLDVLDIIAEKSLKELNSLVSSIYKVNLKFPEEVYNKRLQTLFGLLDKVTVKGVEILKIRSGRGITKSYKLMIEAYKYVGNKIKNFRPPGKGAEYMNSFKKSMNDLSTPVLSKAREYREEARRQIVSSDILSFGNIDLLNDKNLRISVEYFPPYRGVIMDRGGKR